MNNEIQISGEALMSKIYEIRSMKVMLDRDLAKHGRSSRHLSSGAELYGVETKRLKEAVRSNINRFPEDFMFEMTKKEFEIWRTQIATSKSDRKGLRHAPFCFTEQGVAMLSCVLSSERAIAVNIQIVRIFTRMREMLITHKGLLLELEEIRKKISNQDEKIELVFDYLTKFITQEREPRKSIGFKQKKLKNPEGMTK